MKVKIAAVVFLTLFVRSAVYSTENAGPNPENKIAPTGKSDVSLYTGAFTYNFPIEVPPGKMAPNISLNYNSQSGNGWLGHGWSISFPGIFRSTKKGVPVYDDNPTNGTPDNFMVDIGGSQQDLVKTDEGTGDVGYYWEYHTQIEGNFTKFRYYFYGNPSANIWRAWDKSGNYYRFSGQVRINLSGVPNYDYGFYWAVERITDSNRNCSIFEWNNQSYQYEGSTTTKYQVSPVTGTISYIPTSIEYAGHENMYGVITDNPRNKIEFIMSNVREDIFNNNRAGIEQKKDRVLSSIVVSCKYDSNYHLVRKYELGYTKNNISSTSLLSCITQKGNDVAFTLYSTSFTYQHTTGGMVNHVGTYSKGEAPSNGTLREGDFNGDGIADACYFWEGDGGKICTFMSKGDGTFDYYAPTITGGLPWEWDKSKDTFVTGDFNGDGKTDLAYYSYTSNPELVYLLSNGDGTFTKYIQNITTHVGPDYNGQHPYTYTWQVGDFNGDGKSDICYYWYGGVYSKVGCFISNLYIDGYGSFTDTWNTIYKLDYIPDNGTWRVGDFNGDGKTDISLYWWDSGNNQARLSMGISGGDGNFDFVHAYLDNVGQLPTWGGGDYFTWQIADFNGDGLADIYFYRKVGNIDLHLVAINNGDYSFKLKNGDNYIWSTERIDKDYLRLCDLNGDGLLDICGYGDYDNYTRIKALINTGNKFNTISTWGEQPRNSATFRTGDFNGDGKTDIFQYIATNSYDGYTYAGFSNGPADNLLTEVKNGLSGTTNVTYGNPSDSSWAEGTVPLPIQVVKSVTTSDGMNDETNRPSITTNYDYSSGVYDRDLWENREFLGFGIVKTIDPLGNCTTTYFYQNEVSAGSQNINIYKGKIHEQISVAADNALLTRTANTYSYNQPFSGKEVYFPYVSRVDNYLYTSGAATKQTAVEYEYDSYGNVTKTTNLGDVTDNDDNATEITSYLYRNDNKIFLTLPYYKAFYRGVQYGTPVENDRVSTNWFSYDYQANGVLPTNSSDVKGNLTEIKKWNESGADPTVTMHYDSYGNIDWEKDAKENHDTGTGNVITKTYDSVFNSFVTSIVNSLGHKETYDYDYRTGQVSVHTDVNGYGTTYYYDVFGRIARVAGPDDTYELPTVSYTYTFNNSPAHKILMQQRINHGQAGTLDTYTFIDGLSRKCQTRSPAPGTNNQIVSDMVKYNSRGLVEKSYLPYTESFRSNYYSGLSNRPYTITGYDEMGRVTTVTNTDNTSRSINYSGWQETMTDENGIQKDYLKDAYGRIIEVDEHNSGDTYKTIYSYDSLGNLIQITNNKGEDTTIVYDSLGRKASINDPKMGHWSYSYDLNGNLISQTDNKNQTITMTYDRLNRISTKVYPDTNQSTIWFHYDLTTGTNTIGRLTKVEDLSGVTEFVYDDVGRNTKKIRTIDNTTYVSSNTYDALGRELGLTYPDGDNVNYNYESQYQNLHIQQSHFLWLKFFYS